MKVKHANSFVIIAVIALFATIDISRAASKVALVIGNADYQNAPLKNPLNDARAIAAKLQNLGFEIVIGENLNRRSMLGILRDFRQKINHDTEIALLFYAGHGAQYDKESYLIPLDITLNEIEDLPFEAIKAQQILQQIEERRAKVNILILDACRDLPLARSSRSSSRGLAKMTGNSHSLIVYSTAAGAVAADGDGGNSPYTEILLKYLDKPNLTLTQLFNDVGYEVSDKYGQVPWMSSAPIPRIYLKRTDKETANKQPVSEIQPPIRDIVAQPLQIAPPPAGIEQWEPIWADGKTGYIYNGRWALILSQNYSGLGKFNADGLATIFVNDKYGYIDSSGKEVIAQKYNSSLGFKNGLAAVKKDFHWGFIDTSGREVIALQYDSVGDFSREALARVEKNGSFGYINKGGVVVIDIKYEDANDFKNSMARIKKNGKYGYIDSRGAEVIKAQYEDAKDFSNNGLAAVAIKEYGRLRYGYINKRGVVVVPFDYDVAKNFDNATLAAVGIGESPNYFYGFIDAYGNEVVPLQYLSVYPFANNGLARVKNNSYLYGYVNESGREIIPSIYADAGDFAANGLAWVNYGNKVSYINGNGSTIISAAYDAGNDFAGGLALVRQGERWFFINENGQWVMNAR